MTPPSQPLSRLTIWKVGSPHRGDTPAATLPEAFRWQANQLGLSCEVHSFPAKDFHLVFDQAVRHDGGPDVVVIDNYGILKGIDTELGTFTGIVAVIAEKELVFVSTSFNSLRGELGGWVFLAKSSARHAQSLQMASHTPPVPATWMEGTSPASDIAKIRVVAHAAAQAFLNRQVDRLWSMLDHDHMMVHTRDGDSESRSQPAPEMLDMEIARIWGNHQLVFCGVAFTWPAKPNSVGGGYLVVALRLGHTPGGEGRWRVLFVSTDPITVEQLNEAIPKLSREFVGDKAAAVFPVQLSAPANGQIPEPNPEDVLSQDDDARFGFFKWRREPDTKVLAELAEFVSCDMEISEARVMILRANLDTHAGQFSAGWLWSTGSRWQWRIWSIGADGKLAFSPWHEFHH